MRVFHNPNYNFVKWRYHALAASLVVLLAGAYTVVAKGGIPLGVDFSGGTVLVLRFEKATSEDVVRAGAW